MKINQLKNAFNTIEIELTDKMCEQFIIYYELLIEWNAKMNLTAITDETEVIEKHFMDSVLSTKVIDFNNFQSLIDIGTGAGFPGIPLKILYPHLQVTLVDALQKRVQYLNTTIEALELNDIVALHGRAEDLARTDLRDANDVCVSRAVSQLNILCEYCLPFIKPSGYFISYKGSKTMEELENSQNAIKVLGGQVEKVTDSIQLSKELNRGFVCIKKIEETDERYPRRAGKPQKKPL